MRKNIFEVSEEERKQIIDSHVRATKRNYLKENSSDLTHARHVLLSLTKKRSSDVKVIEEGGCVRTYWIDSVYPLDQKLEVVVCNGYEKPDGSHSGWMSIRETSNYQGVEGEWIYNLTNEMITIKICGKEITNKYKAADPTSDGSLFREVFCAFIKYDEIYKWEFWTDWSWNADSLFALSSEYSNCGVNLPEKLKPLVGSGFWDKFLDLLPGDFWS